MRWFRFNSFTVIGLVLLAVGVYSLAKGAGFQFDSGLPAEHGESWFYLLIGALMVVNGLVLPQPVIVDDAPVPAVSPRPEKNAVESSVPAATPAVEQEQKPKALQSQ